MDVREANREQTLSRSRTRVTRARVGAVFSLWLFGLYVCLWASAPVKVTPEQAREFEQAMVTASSIDSQDFRSASLRAANIEEALNEAKVWFWRFRPGHRERVESIQRDLDVELQILATIHHKREQAAADARGRVSVWSEYGVEDARTLFWGSYDRGKEAAKRHTMWDMLFSMGRDEGLVEFLVRLALSFIINLTLGMVIALVSFLWNLYALLVAYQASLWSGLLFFLVCAIGSSESHDVFSSNTDNNSPLFAVSLVVTYIGLVVGAIGGSTYLFVKHVERQRLQGHQPRSLHLD
eukprot:m.15592 g.15592  ORF g.15592 m.15592 type:complete len:295 (+) comp6715_c0_seq2:35-919(+)